MSAVAIIFWMLLRSKDSVNQEVRIAPAVFTSPIAHASLLESALLTFHLSMQPKRRTSVVIPSMKVFVRDGQARGCNSASNESNALAGFHVVYHTSIGELTAVSRDVAPFEFAMARK